VVVGSLTALGYLLSTLRDALLASYYGGSPALDVYFIALSPAQFIGMEAASLAYLAFLPEFASAIQATGPAHYAHLFRERLALASKVALGVAVLLAVLGTVSTNWLAPGYAGHGAIGSLRTSFVVLSALIPGLAVAGVLRAPPEARAQFSPWALLPGFRSATLILCVLASAAHPGLGWLLTGSILGVAVAIGYAALLGRHQHWVDSPSSAPAIGPTPRLPASLAPLVGAILLGELTVIVDNAFASKAGVGGAQAFALASNLLAAPQNIIAGGVATVFFPSYGTLWLANDKRAAFRSLWASMRIAVYGLLPVVVLLVTEGITLVRLVYRHGSFSEDLALLVSETVAGLAVGQVFFASSVLLRQFLLVAGAPWAVCEAAAVFLGMKWIGNAALIHVLGLPGVALASSVAALATCAFLVIRVLRVAAESREPSV